MKTTEVEHKIYLDDTEAIYMYGTECWYLNGELHRTDGPAVITSDGFEYWYLNGKLHRTDGPAIIHPNGTAKKYLKGFRKNGT